MSDSFKSYTFVLIQFVCLGIILLTGPLIPSNYFLKVIEIVAGVLALWAIFTMKIGTFNVTPKIKQGSMLITTGPYRFVRHPMYSSLLIATLVLIINHCTMTRFLAWIVVLLDLILKLRFEEKLLCKAFNDYKSSMQRTKRLIPFVYGGPHVKRLYKKNAYE